MSRCSGIILAGGDGTRLSSLTRRLVGDERPKQFCRLIGDDSLLGQTRRRARLMVAPERLLTVVMRHACDKPITKQQLVMEGIASTLSDKKPIQFHVTVLPAWDVERRAPKS